MCDLEHGRNRTSSGKRTHKHKPQRGNRKKKDEDTADSEYQSWKIAADRHCGAS